MKFNLASNLVHFIDWLFMLILRLSEVDNKREIVYFALYIFVINGILFFLFIVGIFLNELFQDLIG
jgi:hypothetical protein